MREYENVNGNAFPTNSMMAAILQALPIASGTQVQMQFTDSTTQEQLKEKILHYEGITTRWDSTTRRGRAHGSDIVSKGKKGKGKYNEKGKLKNKRKNDGKQEQRWLHFKGVKE